MPASATTSTDTRERILEVSATLFAQRGFQGTGTREIAEAVGIRQPSLFHHFPTKQAILAELLDRDLRPALERVLRLRRSGGSAAARLHAYVAGDVAALIDFPYDARGLYNEDVLGDPAFAGQSECREAFHAEIESLVSEGLTGREFRGIDPGFARQVIHAMTVETIHLTARHPRGDLADRPEHIADFVLLGLLAEPERLPEIKAEAAALA